jgi:membrane protease YdiL (CAAX protease family)
MVSPLANRQLRLVEFALLYLLLPPLLLYGLPPRAILPLLWLATLTAAWLSSRGKRLLLRDEVAAGAVPWQRELRPIIGRWLLAALILTLALYLYQPWLLFAFPRSNLRFWLMVMVCYPFISVWPQALLYRRLYERRYAPLFSSPRASWLIGTLVFGFGHLPFGNLWALLLPTLGGLLFLRTYRRTGRLWLSILEHALYGNLLFTIGWGSFLFHGGTQGLGAAWFR